MMRYQRVSPDCLHLNNGRKQPNIRTYKDEDASENGRIPSYSSSFEGKAAAVRYRSGTTPPRQDHNSFSHFIASSDSPQSDSHTTTTTQKNQNHVNSPSPSPSPSRGGDLLLQWGHNKRSRGSRADNRTVTDESSVQSRQLIKLHRRGGGGLDKHAIINQQQIMKPPPPPPPPLPPPTSSSSCTTTTTTTTHGRGGNLRSFSMPIRDTTGSSLNRNLEDRSSGRNGSSSSNCGAGGTSRLGGVSRSTEKRSPSSPEKTENTKMGSSTVTNMLGEKQQQQQQPPQMMMMNGGAIAQAEHGSRVESTAGASVEQEGGGGVSHGVTTGGGVEKVNLEVFEWPRIYISLSRKEKEDDFYAMKGTKLPQRPKKRAKNIDKTLQYCFPGMWLSDLTRGRYEVREKKCVKKQKRRGLKGMESMESDSE